MSIHLECRSVWKAYPEWSGGPRTLRAALSRRVPLLIRPQSERWALRDITLSLKRGEAVSLIGHNGAGKSTLLRMLAGIGRPTRGRIRVPQRTAAVLTLGDVFDLDLSGRENAISTAMATGLRQRDAEARLAAMVEFAELEESIDAPMRTYSDGMRLRLAFGVVAQFEPDLLLLDEVIAVGDMRFQEKCMARVQEMRHAGAALVLASHALDQVAAESDRVLWLEHGAVRMDDKPDLVLEAYAEAMHVETLERTPDPDHAEGTLVLRENRFGTQELTIEDVTLVHADGGATDAIRSGAALGVNMTLVPGAEGVQDPIVSVTITRQDDEVVCYETSTDGDGIALGWTDAPLPVSLTFPRLDLIPGRYMVDVGVYEGSWSYSYDYHWHVYPLAVTGAEPDKGVFRPGHSWQVRR
jgi:lipopolysaccharide transport system ATP-binding protein